MNTMTVRDIQEAQGIVARLPELKQVFERLGMFATAKMVDKLSLEAMLELAENRQVKVAPEYAAEAYRKAGGL